MEQKAGKGKDDYNIIMKEMEQWRKSMPNFLPYSNYKMVNNAHTNTELP